MLRFRDVAKFRTDHVKILNLSGKNTQRSLLSKDHQISLLKLQNVPHRSFVLPTIKAPIKDPIKPKLIRQEKRGLFGLLVGYWLGSGNHHNESSKCDPETEKYFKENPGKSILYSALAIVIAPWIYIGILGLVILSVAVPVCGGTHIYNNVTGKPCDCGVFC